MLTGWFWKILKEDGLNVDPELYCILCARFENACGDSMLQVFG